MRSISINGNTIVVSGGGSVKIVNGRVIVDGQDMTPDAKDIRIEIHGDVARLDVDVCTEVVVNGTVGQLSTSSGDVKCGDVAGSVQTSSGDVRCKGVTGSVQSVSGDVQASHIAGSVRTVSGDIN